MLPLFLSVPSNMAENTFTQSLKVLEHLAETWSTIIDNDPLKTLVSKAMNKRVSSELITMQQTPIDNLPAKGS